MLVHTDNDLLARFDRTLLLVGAARDRLLEESALNRLDRTSTSLHRLHQLPGCGLEPIGQPLHVPAAAEWVDDLRNARFVGEQLLRAQRQGGAPFGRQRE